MGISEQALEILDELFKVNQENLNEKARKLFDTVMEIADERDLYKERINKAINEINYWGIDKEHNDNSVMRRALKGLLNILQGNDD